MNRIYIRDHKYRDNSLWPETLKTKLEIDLSAYSSDDPWAWSSSVAEPANSNSNFGKENVLVFVHAGTLAEMGEWIAASQKSLKGHIVFISTQRGLNAAEVTKAAASAGVTLSERIHACFWSVSDLHSAAIPRVAALIKYLRTDNPDFSLLQPDSLDQILALLLLCEAWLHVHALQGKGSADGFVISAPNTSTEWFAPFGLVPSTQAVRDIAGQVGESAKLKVETFLAEIIACDSVGPGDENMSVAVEELAESLRSVVRSGSLSCQGLTQ